jgi:hypothetical protein
VDREKLEEGDRGGSMSDNEISIEDAVEEMRESIRISMQYFGAAIKCASDKGANITGIVIGFKLMINEIERGAPNPVLFAEMTDGVVAFINQQKKAHDENTSEV